MDAEKADILDKSNKPTSSLFISHDVTIIRKVSFKVPPYEASTNESSILSKKQELITNKTEAEDLFWKKQIEKFGLSDSDENEEFY
jgi:hypothetical protein